MKFVSILLASILIASLVGLSNFDSAFAQTYNGVLTLDPIPSKVALGDVVVFSGKFSTTSGQAIPNETIYIKAVVALARDKVIAAGVTDNNGKFNVSWIAHENYFPQFPFYFYASYEGQGKTYEIKSSVYSLTVDTWFIPSTSITTGGGSKSVTTIELDKFQSSVYVGEYVTFTGKVLKNGNPVAYAPVEIKKKDPSDTVPIQTLAETRTDSDGKFKITWKATVDDFFKVHNVYAQVYNGAIVVDRTPSQTLTVLKYGGSISLDPFPPSGQIGELITFSGTLKLDNRSPEGAIVYIKDRDTLSLDDLLTTAYVESNGKFSARWFVINADFDKELEIYAVFEGNDILYRLTTCDREPTMPLGSGCPYIRPFRVLEAVTPPPVTPTPSDSTGNEYMKLFYSLDFSTSPKVVIVPSPDSYNEVSSHIGPVIDGILLWQSLMQQKYGGNWNVNFEVIEPGTSFFPLKPDVIVNLVTHDDEVECISEYAGWADIWENPKKPVETLVCSTSLGQKRPNTSVSATAAHEFIHAVGLGHTFNKKGDLMCSVENGKLTCPYSSSKSKTPSTLNLAATAKLYGTDGFKNPNNGIVYLSEFRLGDPLTSNTPFQPTPIAPKLSELPVYISFSTDKGTYRDGGTIVATGTVYNFQKNLETRLVMKDPSNNILAYGQVQLDDREKFRNKFILSSIGMPSSGSYSLTLQHGASSEKIYFSYTIPSEIVQPTPSIQNNDRKIGFSNLRFVDSFGNRIINPTVGEKYQITADITNFQNREQPFAFLVQVQDSRGKTAALAWITGSLSPENSFSPALTWTPEEAGTYSIAVFLQKSADFQNDNALAQPLKKQIYVQNNEPKPAPTPVPTPAPIPSSQTSPTGSSINVEGFSVSYQIAGGSVLNITPYLDANSLVIQIFSSSNGQLTITLPRGLIDSKIGSDDDDLFVLADGAENDFDETKTSKDRTLTIPFRAGVEEIEIIGTGVFENLPSPIPAPTPAPVTPQQPAPVTPQQPAPVTPQQDLGKLELSHLRFEQFGKSTTNLVLGKEVKFSYLVKNSQNKEHYFDLLEQVINRSGKAEELRLAPGSIKLNQEFPVSGSWHPVESGRQHIKVSLLDRDDHTILLAPPLEMWVTVKNNEPKTQCGPETVMKNGVCVVESNLYEQKDKQAKSISENNLESLYDKIFQLGQSFRQQFDNSDVQKKINESTCFLFWCW